MGQGISPRRVSGLRPRVMWGCFECKKAGS
jgi:hypothetical protein